ncbi:MAG TPA: aldo/keto reductase [Dehalococcoidia bacterium]|nr:aldo/keto reductase [Dehalococcoidia bacterium]
MEYRNLGRSGLQVSAAGLGCNNFGMRIDKEQTAVVVNRALELGVNFFDTANIYGGTRSEEFLGAALGDRRKKVVVATKFVGPAGEGPLYKGASRAAIFRAIEDSLRRLGTDWIDLYQIHFPDVSTPIEATLRALEDLVRQGKILYYGCSNFSGWQVAEAQAITRNHNLSPLISAQNEYNLLDRRIERELVPACEAEGLGVLPYFPLASGFLSGKYRQGERPPEGTRIAAWGARGEEILSDRNFAILSGLESFAQARGKTVLDLAIGWLASHTYIPTVISGATKPEQVEQNVAAADWRLTPEEMSEVDVITKRRD